MASQNEVNPNILNDPKFLGKDSTIIMDCFHVINCILCGLACHKINHLLTQLVQATLRDTDPPLFLYGPRCIWFVLLQPILGQYSLAVWPLHLVKT